MNLNTSNIIAFNNYARKMKWKRVDFDWAYKYQCVDLIRDYANYRSYPAITTRGNAIDLWKKGLGNNYTRVVNSMLGNPPVWAIMLYSTWEFGHIAIAWRSSLLWVELLEQNAQTWNGEWLGEDAIRVKRNYYQNCLGWFIPIIK